MQFYQVSVLNKTDATDSNVPSNMYNNDGTTKSFSATINGKTQKFVVCSNDYAFNSSKVLSRLDS